MHTYRIQCTIDLRKPRTQLLSSVWHHSTNVLKMYYSTVLTHDRQRKQLPSLAHTLAAPAKPVVVIQNWLTGWPMSHQCLTLLNCSLLYFIRICSSYWVTEMTRAQKKPGRPVLQWLFCVSTWKCHGLTVWRWHQTWSITNTTYHKQSTVVRLRLYETVCMNLTDCIWICIRIWSVYCIWLLSLWWCDSDSSFIQVF